MVEIARRRSAYTGATGGSSLKRRLRDFLDRRAAKVEHRSAAALAENDIPVQLLEIPRGGHT
jgi:hypothetical protein